MGREDDSDYNDSSTFSYHRKMQRTRCPNFSKREQKLLDKLVQGYPQIHNKCTKLESVNIKNRAWEELTKDFNSYMGGETFRTVEALRKRYDNTKKRKSKPLKSSPKASEADSNDDSRQSDDNYMFEHTNVDTGDSYVESSMKIQDSDDDSFKEEGQDHKEFIRVQITSDNNENGLVSETENVEHEDKNGTDYLNDTGNNISQTNCDVTEDLASQQKRCLLWEHRMKLKHLKERHDIELSIIKRQMQEKHELELKIIKAEHTERMKIMKEEHFKKMKMLELEGSIGIINQI